MLMRPLAERWPERRIGIACLLLSFEEMPLFQAVYNPQILRALCP
jgi:hypothetical protein